MPSALYKKTEKYKKTERNRQVLCGETANTIGTSMRVTNLGIKEEKAAVTCIRKKAVI